MSDLAMWRTIANELRYTAHVVVKMKSTVDGGVQTIICAVFSQTMDEVSEALSSLRVEDEAKLSSVIDDAKVSRPGMCPKPHSTALRLFLNRFIMGIP